MRAFGQVFKYGALDLLRSRFLFGYGLFFFGASTGLLFFAERAAQSVVSLLEIELLAVPLVGFVFAIVHYWNSREFLEMLLAQPVNRSSVFLGHYLGLMLPLGAVFAAGTGLPFVVWGKPLEGTGGTVAILVAAGVLLNAITTAISYWLVTRFEDRVKALGLAVTAWLVFAFLFDGLLFFVGVRFHEYPLEKPMLLLSMLNPVDLARVAVMLRLDVAALMGYTGALYQEFFGSAAGVGLAIAILAVWFAVPLAAGLFSFRRKDF
jgi:Cu-processing system permease protein